MYHLGSLSMVLSGALDDSSASAYLSSLAGKFAFALHGTETAKNLGVETASRLPWMVINNVVNGDIWDWIFTVTFSVVRQGNL